MTKLGWRKVNTKWSGKDCIRAIWVADGHWIERGVVKGLNGYAQGLTEHLKEPELLPTMDVPAG